MCKLCERGFLQPHGPGSRRHFLKATSSAAGVAAAGGLGLFNTAARAHGDDDAPEHSGRHGRRVLIRGGAVMSMNPRVGDFPQGDVLVEGKKILAVGRHIHAHGAAVIDARGRIVMPGFIDTHHHQFETALRSFLADGILINDGKPHGAINYFEYILLKFAPVYRPQDVYINELFGGLSQLDAGVTTVLDISQIHHSPEHSDAVIEALRDTGRRAMLGYFESAGNRAGNQYPQDAKRVAGILSSDDLVGFVMGGEVYLGEPTYSEAWRIAREELKVQIAAHILSPFGIAPILDDLAAGTGGVNNNIGLGPDNLFIHMTGMSDTGWNGVKNSGAQVSIAFPIEMNMRHGIPPIVKMQQLGLEPSLSTDVETNMTADFFTQMRSAMTMQRMVINQAVLETGDFVANPWPPFPADLPP